MAQEYDRRTIEELIDGTISFTKLKEMLSSFKDPGRFDTYVSILQERVPWNDKILLPYGLHLYVVLKKDGSRVIRFAGTPLLPVGQFIFLSERPGGEDGAFEER